MKRKVVTDVLVMLLMWISAWVAGQQAGEALVMGGVWIWIALYWAVLLLKNIIDWIWRDQG